MKSKGTFIFKGIENKSGGEFTNEKGRLIKYDESYVLKFDEQKDGIIYDRKVKISKKETSLIEKIKSMRLYSPVEIEFNVNFYANGVVLTVADIASVDEDTDELSF